MPAKPKNINYKSYLLYIEFVQNELDPCWEIYHAPKIKTFIQKDSLLWSIITLEAWAMQKYEYFEEIKRSNCSTTSLKKMDKCPAVELGIPRYPPEKNEIW